MSVRPTFPPPPCRLPEKSKCSSSAILRSIGCSGGLPVAGSSYVAARGGFWNSILLLLAAYDTRRKRRLAELHFPSNPLYFLCACSIAVSKFAEFWNLNLDASPRRRISESGVIAAEIQSVDNLWTHRSRIDGHTLWLSAFGPCLFGDPHYRYRFRCFCRDTCRQEVSHGGKSSGGIRGGARSLFCGSHDDLVGFTCKSDQTRRQLLLGSLVYGNRQGECDLPRPGDNLQDRCALLQRREYGQDWHRR